MENSILETILEYGESAGEKGTTKKAFLDWAQNKCAGKGSSSQKTYCNVPVLCRIFNECFEMDPNPGTEQSQAPKYYLKPVYYFKLAEFRRQRQTFKTVKWATRTAISAIIVSAAAVIFCVVLNHTRTNTQGLVQQADLKTLIETNHAAVTGKMDNFDTRVDRLLDELRQNNKREVRLDGLQMRQILTAIESGQKKQPQTKMRTMPSNEVEHHELINRYFEENQ